jgi:hypothetical protein
MRPLIYLTYRSTFNGVKRALTSGKRLISLILLIGYYVMVFIRPFGSDGASRRLRGLPGEAAFNLPPLEMIEAVVFAAFTGISLLLMLGVLGYKGSFRPADVDVLFPTPVNPRLVLIFRIVRDYLITLLVPLFIALVGYRPAAAGIGYLFRNLKDPAALGQMLKAATVAWLLVAMCWVCIGYAASLFVNRSDLNSDRNRRIITWSLILGVVALAAYVFFSIRTMTSFEDAVAFSHSPVLRTVFFTASWASLMVMGPLYGNAAMMLLGAGALVLVILCAVQVAMTQVGWMYDQAAARGFDAINIRALQRKGDAYGILAEQARMGKLKAGRQRWLHRIAVSGPGALIWKEVIIQLRSALTMIVLFVPIVIFMTLIPLLAMDEPNSPRAASAFFIGMQAFGVFMMSMSFAQTGFIEVLRRVDLQKPLPFPSSTTVTMEIVAKAIPSIIVSYFATLVAFCVRPVLWQECFASLIVMPFISALICAAVFLVTILFPDVDDPTQRGFRGLMILLAIIISGSPGVLAFASLFGFGASPIIAAIVAAALNMGILAGIATIAGSQYATYNPSE